MTRINATEPTGPNLGSTSDGSFQDAIDRAAEGYREPEITDTMVSDPNALLPTALVVVQTALRERPTVKLGPAAVAASGAPDTVLKAVREAGERVMSVLRSASGALSVESLVAAHTEVAVEPTIATSDLPTSSTGLTANTTTGVIGSTTLDAAVSLNNKSTEALLMGESVDESLADLSTDKSVTNNASAQNVSGEDTELAATDDARNTTDLKSGTDGQSSSSSTIAVPGVQRGASRPVSGESALEAYSKFETAQGAWKPLWISRAAKSLSARVETSVGPITMRLERGIDGNVTDVVAPEVLRGAIERGLASDANDLLDKDTQYRWRYVREHNEQREKPRQQESGDDNE